MCVTSQVKEALLDELIVHQIYCIQSVLEMQYNSYCGQFGVITLSWKKSEGEIVAGALHNKKFSWMWANHKVKSTMEF